jgi:hypothetical protein
VLSRRTPLKARTSLRRKTPLQSRAAGMFGPGSSLKRSQPRHAKRKDTGPDRRTLALVLKRDGYACVCCGRSIAGQRYSLQHRKRRSQGGTNSPVNLITVLGDGTAGCHARIDSRIDPHDEAKGYTVRSHGDPALVPVMIFSEHGGGVTAWLTEDGGFAFEAPAGAA